MEMINQPIITLDVDWAPDFVIEYVADLLIAKKIKSTWFVTHDSPIWNKLLKNKLFELGLHPNFSENSSQGKDPDSILKYLKTIIPNAKSIRTHSLLQSSHLLLKFQKYGIENDVSLNLEKTPNLVPHHSKFFNLFRFPFFWGDGHEMVEVNQNWSMNNSDYSLNGLKIFYFHPIHIFLNSKNWDKYNLLKNEVGLLNMNPGNSQDYINKENGTCTLFNNIIQYLENKQSFTIQDLKKYYF